jgi:hypothetical protein
MGQTKMNKQEKKYLFTDVLPSYNCANCEHFNSQYEILSRKSNNGDYYAVECNNFVHPLKDCILRGFEGHSAQPGFSQTINTRK